MNKYFKKVNDLKKNCLKAENLNPNLFGYTRVSSRQQSTNGSLLSQKKILIDFGVPLSNIFSDVKSGVRFEDRVELSFLLKKFNPENIEAEKIKIKNEKLGTTLVVCYLDRISRNLSSGLELIKQLENMGVSFISLDMPLVDKKTPEINKLIFIILMWISEFSIKNKKERQLIGIRKAISDGKYLHRKKSKLTPELLIEIKKKLERKLSPKEIYLSLKISRSSFYTAKKILKNTD